MYIALCSIALAASETLKSLEKALRKLTIYYYKNYKNKK